MGGGDSAPRREPTDPLTVLAALSRHGVDYVVIGGVAVQAHGSPRTTQDIDLVTDSAPENMVRLAAALRELGVRLAGVDADLLGVDPTDPDDLRAGANFALESASGGIDLWTDADVLPGSAPWEELRARALEADVLGEVVVVASVDDLIAMKRVSAPNRDSAAKRDQDLKDIAVLGGSRDHEPGEGEPRQDAAPEGPDLG